MSFMHGLKRELKEVGVVTLYSFCGFLVIVAILKLVLQEHEIDIKGLSKALVGALIVGKVAVIMRHTPFLDRMYHRRGYVNVLFNTAVLMVGVFVVLMLERVIEAWREVGAFGPAVEEVLRSRDMHHVLAVTIAVTALLLCFNILSQISRVIGRERLLGVFFARPDERDAG